MSKQTNLVINGKGGVRKNFFATNVVGVSKIAGKFIAPWRERFQRLSPDRYSKLFDRVTGAAAACDI